MQQHLDPDEELAYPKLRRGLYRVTSPKDKLYNCIAYAAGKNDIHWWPYPLPTVGINWPIERTDETIECFIEAFATKGYIECKNMDACLEPGIEKVAIYAGADGEPTHMARQLENGKWTSKLGYDEDIEHDTLESLECPVYGMVAAILRRPRTEKDSPDSHQPLSLKSFDGDRPS